MKDPTEIHWLDIKRRGQKESSGHCPFSGVSRGWAEFMSPFPHCWVSALLQPSDFWSEWFKMRHRNIKVIWEEDGEPCYLRVLLSLLSKERFFQLLCYLREIILGSHSLACMQLENRLSFNMKYAIQIQNSSFEIKSIYLIFTALDEEQNQDRRSKKQVGHHPAAGWLPGAWQVFCRDETQQQSSQPALDMQKL